MKIAVHITHYDQAGSQNTGALKMKKFDYLQKILKKYFDKMRQAESLEKSGSALGDLSDAAKLRKGIPYNSSTSIQKELDQLQGVEKLDTDLLAILKKQYNL